MRFGFSASLKVAVVLLVLGAAVGLLFLQQMASERLVRGYWLGVIAQSGIALVASAAVAAVGGSIEGARLRSARITDRLTRKSDLAVVARAVAPPLVAAIVVQLIALISLLPFAGGSPDMLSLALLGAFVSVILFHLMGGFAIGLSLPIVASVPIALTLSYVWLGAAWSVDFFAVRHMAGLILSDCCDIYETVDPASITTALIFNLGAGFAVWWWIRSRLLPRSGRRSLQVTLAAGFAVTTLVVSLGVAGPLGPFARVERNLAELTCTTPEFTELAYEFALESEAAPNASMPTTCFYPEQDPNGEFASSLKGTWGSLRDLGLLAPRLVVAANKPVSDVEVGVMATPVFPAAVVSRSLISNLVGSVEICEPSEWEARDKNYRVLMDFLVIAAVPDLSAADFQSLAMLDALEAAEATQILRAAEAVSQGEPLDEGVVNWYQNALAAVTSCDVKIEAPF